MTTVITWTLPFCEVVLSAFGNLPYMGIFPRVSHAPTVFIWSGDFLNLLCRFRLLCALRTPTAFRCSQQDTTCIQRSSWDIIYIQHHLLPHTATSRHNLYITQPAFIYTNKTSSICHTPCIHIPQQDIIYISYNLHSYTPTRHNLYITHPAFIYPKKT